MVVATCKYKSVKVGVATCRDKSVKVVVEKYNSMEQGSVWAWASHTPYTESSEHRQMTWQIEQLRKSSST